MDFMYKKVGGGVLLVLALTGGYEALARSGKLDILMDGAALQAWVTQLGVWGPLVVIALMTTAIVWSPLPSAPIALAAGAAYGQLWGALYVLLGSELGSLTAFTLARWLGWEALSRRFSDRLALFCGGSQAALMAVVFVTRLLPFLSFDIVSYAAGPTALKPWRFAAATLAGIAPASFLLAHFGSEMTSGNVQRIVTTVFLLFGLTAIPVALKWSVKACRSDRLSVRP